MPFCEDFNKIFWQVLIGFLISTPLAMITTPINKIWLIIVYVITVFIILEIYFLIKWFFVYRKENIF